MSSTGAAHELPLVLVVEDDPAVRAVLVAMLVEDYRVVAVPSAEAAFEAADQLAPDLILCDLALPGVSGEELLQRLRRNGTFDTPMLVVTGSNDAAQRVRLLRSGAVDFVTKPFLPDELRARIDNVLAGRLDLDRLRERVEAAQALAAQLQHALDSRVVIEPA
ncbi:MAG: response regulator [Acidimicrobiales bacterium]|nr:response regulator [Acidimicrobiales bacterium]